MQIENNDLFLKIIIKYNFIILLELLQVFKKILLKQSICFLSTSGLNEAISLSEENPILDYRPAYFNKYDPIHIL